MEVHLSKNLSEKRVFPAIDINKSGTRREELLLTPAELSVSFSIRRALSNMSTIDMTERVIELITSTKNNLEFLEKVQTTKIF